MTIRFVPRPGNPRSQPVQKIGQVDDFRLAGRVVDDRFAVGQDGGHHQVFGTGYRNFVQHEHGAMQPVRLRANVTVLDLDRRAHGPQPGNVQIDRAGADRATAGQRHIRTAEPPQ